MAGKQRNVGRDALTKKGLKHVAHEHGAVWVFAVGRDALMKKGLKQVAHPLQAGLDVVVGRDALTKKGLKLRDRDLESLGQVE